MAKLLTSLVSEGAITVQLIYSYDGYGYVHYINSYEKYSTGQL